MAAGLTFIHKVFHFAPSEMRLALLASGAIAGLLLVRFAIRFRNSRRRLEW